MKKITPKQQQVFDYLTQYQQENGYPPTVREICSAIGFKSPSTAHFHLEGLIEAGYLERQTGKTRALKILGQKRSEPENKVIEFPQREFETEANEVPVVGNVAAGAPILAEQNVEDVIYFDTGKRSGEHFALRVRGESMLGAGILPGDLVIVHQQSDVRNGDIVVALFEHEATVKTLSRKGGAVWLLPENDAYEPIDGRFAEIIGKVVGVIRRY
jgi:SOS regulatory protein LexA